MKEQFIYMAKVRNIHTNDCFVKLGYTSDILNRVQQLQSHNKHYEYSDYQLFKHEKKNIGYFYDEQKIHESNKRDRAPLRRDSMPDGYTECYDSTHRKILAQQLSVLGYHCVYDEREPKPTPMFVWQ